METKASSGWRKARVEDGDAEAPRVEERRELEHRVEVAMERQGEEDDAAAVATVAVLLSSGHGPPAEWLLGRSQACDSEFGYGQLVTLAALCIRLVRPLSLCANCGHCEALHATVGERQLQIWWSVTNFLGPVFPPHKRKNVKFYERILLI